jgi:hypothetical protein
VTVTKRRFSFTARELLTRMILPERVRSLITIAAGLFTAEADPAATRPVARKWEPEAGTVMVGRLSAANAVPLVRLTLTETFPFRECLPRVAEILACHAAQPGPEFLNVALRAAAAI